MLTLVACELASVTEEFGNGGGVLDGARPAAEKNLAARVTQGGSGRFLRRRGRRRRGGARGGLRFVRGGPQRLRRTRDGGGATSAMVLARV